VNNNNHNHNTFVERHSAVASEALSIKMKYTTVTHALLIAYDRSLFRHIYSWQ